MKARIPLFLLAVCSAVSAQTVPSPSQLVDKAIAYHDPRLKLLQSNAVLRLLETRPDGTSRETEIHFNYLQGSFYARSASDGHVLEYAVGRDTQWVKLDGSSDIREVDRERFRIRPNRAVFMRNYYTYLFGMPMKLRDPGTHVAEEVELTTFVDQPALALKVRYDPNVGTDTWIFYFQPELCALTGYRFFHNENQGDGEYIVLQGEVKAKNIVLPKTLLWYTNQEDKFLGKDEIVEFLVL